MFGLIWFVMVWVGLGLSLLLLGSNVWFGVGRFPKRTRSHFSTCDDQPVDDYPVNRIVDDQPVVRLVGDQPVDRIEDDQSTSTSSTPLKRRRFQLSRGSLHTCGLRLALDGCRSPALSCT